MTPAEKVRVIQKLSWDYKLDIPLEIAQLPRFAFYDHNQQQSGDDKLAQAKMEIAAICHKNKADMVIAGSQTSFITVKST